MTNTALAKGERAGIAQFQERVGEKVGNLGKKLRDPH